MRYNDDESAFRIKHTTEKLASHGGLILIGDLINGMNIQKSFNQIDEHCVDPKFSHTDILSTIIGLLSITKPDYDAIMANVISV